MLRAGSGRSKPADPYSQTQGGLLRFARNDIITGRTETSIGGLSYVNKTPSKKEQRRLAREAREAQKKERQRRERLRSLQIIGAVAALAVVIIAWMVWGATRPKSASVGTAYPDQGRDHIVSGQPHLPYNSNPPTSGWHNPAPAPWGFYPNELPDEVLVHNLEHGGIWISYHDPNDTEVADKLLALSKRFPRKVIITLRQKNDSRIALAAWTWLLKLDHYDEKQIIDFINAHINRGPEKTLD